MPAPSKWRKCRYTAIYKHIHTELINKFNLPASRANTFLAVFFTFVNRFNAECNRKIKNGALDIDDPAFLLGLKDDKGALSTVRDVWMRSCEDCVYSRTYQDVARRGICTITSMYSPDVAHAMNPMHIPESYKYKEGTTIVRADRSQNNKPFAIHICLPGCVRMLQKDNAVYSSLSRIAYEYIFGVCRHNPTRQHVCRMTCFYYKVFTKLPELCTLSSDQLWLRISKMSIADWLNVYEQLYESKQIRNAVFEKHVLHIQTLHHILVQKTDCRDELQFRSHVSRLQCQLCHSRNAHSKTAFTPEEIKCIIDACTGEPLSQFIVILLLTTGLRIGGLCRLYYPGLRNRPITTPTTLCTTEKNGLKRVVHLTASCRILLAGWLDSCRSVHSDYVFPGRKTHTLKTHEHTSTACMWKKIKRILDRAQVQGHPHSFRHTLIHLMWVCGCKWESIAKWVGHSSATTTCTVYGKLRQEDITASIQGVPFISDDTKTHKKWLDIARMIDKPYGL